MEEAEKLPRVFECPFYQWQRGYIVYCEAGRLEFSNGTAYADYCDRFCGSPNGWNGCTLAQALGRDYDRRKNNGTEHRQNSAAGKGAVH